MANMTLCSEEKIDLSNPVMRVQPDITETHHPIPHLTVVEQIKKNLSLSATSRLQTKNMVLAMKVNVCSASWAFTIWTRDRIQTTNW